MFCRACWANIPDGSRECSRCHADPSVPPAGTPARAPRPPAPPVAVPARSRGGDRTNRLIGLVAVLVAVLIGGPPAAEWAGRRWRDDAGVPPSGPGPPRPVERPALVSETPAAEPVVPAAGAGPQAALMREAYALYQAGRIHEACDRYRDVVDRGASDQARRNLGVCLTRLGRDADQADRPAQAVDYYQRALEAYGEAPGVWAALALAHLKGRDAGRAQSVLEQATQRFPDDADVRYLLAEVQERQGRTKEAGDSLRQLLARHPGHGRGQTLLASIEREQKVEGGYWSQESRHFLVRYEGALGLDVGRSVVDYLEDAHDSIGRDLGYFPPDRVQVGIYQEEVLGEVIGVPAHFIRGAFDGRKIRLNMRQTVAYSNDLSRLVRHEYTHAVIHALSKGRAPIWVHEGLAQVMEPRSAPRGLVSVPRQYLTLGGIERLARTLDPAAFTAGYGLTHVAVEHLVERGGLARVREFLGRLGQGDSVEHALRQVFGFGADEVEGRLLAASGRR